ncbi:MAG: hypothetical protein AB7T49_13335 [Oligoflexales bacterium]
MKMIRVFTVLMTVAGLLNACGDATSELQSNDKQSSEITTTITEVPTPTHLLGITRLACNPTGGALFAGIEIGVIINIAKMVWDIIKENRPVANVCIDYANALPKGITDVTQLNGFSQLQFKSYNYQAKNALGVLADITYTVVHQFGGQYQGKGKFLSTVSIIPSNLHVSWGQNVDFRTTNVAATNVGTETDPIGSIVMETQLEVSSVFSKTHKTQIFQVNGDSPDVKVVTP